MREWQGHTAKGHEGLETELQMSLENRIYQMVNACFFYFIRNVYSDLENDAPKSSLSQVLSSCVETFWLWESTLFLKC